MLVGLRGFISDLLANLLAGLLAPSTMMGLATVAAWVAVSVVLWHRRQRAEGKPGMASAYFVGLCFGIALLAVAGGVYGLAIRSLAMPQSDGATVAIPRTQPYRMTKNNLPADRQTIIRVSDGANISPDPGNADFQIYSLWLSAKNMPDPAEATLAPLYAPRSPGDADKEIPFVDQLYNFVRSNPASMPSKGQELLRKWTAAISYTDQSASYTKEVDKFFYELHGANNKLIAMARESDQYCSNDLCVIVADADKHTKEFIEAIGNFENAFNSLSKIIDRTQYPDGYLKFSAAPESAAGASKRANFAEILTPHVERINRLLVVYGIWVSWVEYRLLERRDQLSKIASRQ